MVSHEANLPVDALDRPRLEVPSYLRTGGIVGATALGAGVALDLLSQVTLWRKGSTEIVTGETSSIEQGTPRWLAIPGLGRQDGRFIAEELDGVLPGVIDWAKFSSHGITNKSVGRALTSYYSEYFKRSESETKPQQNVLLHSMGLPTYLKGLEWCLKNGSYVPPIGVMMAFSSPMDAKNTYMEKHIIMTARIPYPGGVLSKLGVEFYQRHQSEDFKYSAIGRCLLGALKCSYKDFPPALWSSQVRTIASGDTYQDGIFDGVIMPLSRIIHVGDVHDKRVNVPMARQCMSGFLSPYGATLEVVNTPGEEHANIAATRNYLPQLSLE